jgi:hypothetical protein
LFYIFERNSYATEKSEAIARARRRRSSRVNRVVDTKRIIGKNNIGPQIKGEEGDAANMGVSYEVRLHIAENADDYRGSKKDTVNMSIRRVRESGEEHLGLFLT